MTAARALDEVSIALREWVRRIANAAKSGGGLDEYRTALDWVRQNMPSDNGLRANAIQEILDITERHLWSIHDLNVVDVIYFSIFPEDAVDNNDLDADVKSWDRERAKGGQKLSDFQDFQLSNTTVSARLPLGSSGLLALLYSTLL